MTEETFTQKTDNMFSAPSPRKQVAYYTSGKNRTLLLIVIVVIILVGLIFGVRRMMDGQGQPTSLSASSNTQIAEPKEGGAIAREFSFPLTRDKDPKQFKFYLDKAELRDEIVIKGQKANAVKGRDFLIITVKITNSENQAFKINTRDFVRLSVNGNAQEWLAPDIHNDPVEVQAISTKVTRVGFPVNESDTSFSLQVGEIGGQKEVIQLDLR